MTVRTYTPQAKVTLFKNVRRDEAREVAALIDQAVALERQGGC